MHEAKEEVPHMVYTIANSAYKRKLREQAFKKMTKLNQPPLFYV